MPTHHDLLISGLMGAGTNGQIITNDISTGAITIGLSNVSYPGGVSGIIVDNDEYVGAGFERVLQHSGCRQCGQLCEYALRREADAAQFAISKSASRILRRPGRKSSAPVSYPPALPQQTQVS